MRSLKVSALTIAATALFAFSAAAADGPGVSYGQKISEADVKALDIDVSTSTGAGLPAGSGTVADGAKIYAEKCVACHGEGANGGSMYGPMHGGIGSFVTPKRKLTPGSMYPYAPILFDYIRRAMPMDSPQSLNDNEVYALTAYIYSLNGLVKEDAVLDAKSLAAIKMPNKDGFVVDDRPDVKAVRCMADCTKIKP
ncbi:MAG: cytochrome c [Alphaproteobacteria bacterium]|nr:cytochrome c [Alphaproteobacteria bacterium]